MTFCTYQITNTVSGKRYVGHTYRFNYRMYQHRFHLTRGDHPCGHLQRAWDKYGDANFTFEKLAEYPTLTHALAAEQRLLDISSDLYNSSPTATSTLGSKRTPETKAKMSAWQKGVPKSVEHRAKISATLTGTKLSEDRKQRQRIAMTGREILWGDKISVALRARYNTPALRAFGKSQTLNEWAAEYEINKGTLSNRLHRAGMSLEAALTVPLARGKNMRHVHVY